MNKGLYLLAALAIVAVFSFGYYKGQKSVNVVQGTKLAEVVDKETDKHEEIVTIKDKDGNIKTVDKIDTVAKTRRVKQQDTTTVAISKPKTNLSLLGGYNFEEKQFVYGLSLTKEVYGPLTVGVFGFNNKTAGLSVGISLP